MSYPDRRGPENVLAFTRHVGPETTVTSPNKLGQLRAAVRRAEELVHDLRVTASPEAIEAIADALYAALTLARGLARPIGDSGCRRHPDGAADPFPPEGWGDCLVCNTQRHRGQIRDDDSVRASVDRLRAAAHVPRPSPRLIADPSSKCVDEEEAAAQLGAMPDLGAASLEAARLELGEGAVWEDLVVYAAAHPVQRAASSGTAEQTRTVPSGTGRPGTGPDCGTCGTALDPNGTCLTCATTPQNGASS